MRRAAIFFKWILAILFIAAGALHFIAPNFYARMMPPILPAPVFLVYLSGALEIILGILLLVSRFSRFAAWGLIALLIAVFPANIYMAMNPEQFPEFSENALLARLPFQIVFIAWAFRYAKRDK